METEISEYTKRLALAFWRNPELFPKGEVSIPQIAHDDWCRLLTSQWSCNCDPDVVVTTREGRFRVLKEGSVVQI